MSFVITAGGTGGHVSPALAVAAELERLGKHVIFVGSIGGMEERLAREAGLPYQAFAAKGFDRQKPWTLLTSSLVLARSTGKARKWLREIDAEAVGAFGGYVSVPVGQAAEREKIPLLIHEQNSTMGWTNKHLSTYAEVIALTYAAAADGLDAKAHRRVQLTGNPVRPDFSALSNEDHAARLRSELRRRLGFGDDDLVLLVFGGSQGARHINQAIVKLAPELMKRPGLAVLHLTGRKEYASVEAALTEVLGSGCAADAGFSSATGAGSADADYGSARDTVRTDAGSGSSIGSGSGDAGSGNAVSTDSVGGRWKLMDYCDEMPAAFAAADIVVSRAGASSLAELSAAAKPAVLVPFPYATADHQRKNAESLVAAGAAQMVLDAELDSPRFREVLLSLVDSAENRASMLEVAQQCKDANAATRVAELLIGIAR